MSSGKSVMNLLAQLLRGAIEGLYVAGSVGHGEARIAGDVWAEGSPCMTERSSSPMLTQSSIGSTAGAAGHDAKVGGLRKL